ncbi:inactive serine/threonine-protein kinase 19 isoform X3 [Pongo pygmaeus]|uniref:inactive serine/threonine-protein kinase 19 isoform X3 n=1 Tax=Pongo pygmaeus TaxID=9600 RepID=UPI00300C07D7
MSRKRHHLIPETLGVKRRRKRGPVESDSLRGEPGSARAAVSELMQLFPRGLFEDALPPIVLRSQVYSLVPDRTVADRQLVRGVGATAGSPFPNSWNFLSHSHSASRSASIRPFRRGHCARHWGATETLLKGPQKELQEQGEIRIVQLGFDLDAHGIIFTEDYKTRVLKACDGRPYAGAVQKFLASVLPACGDLSFQQDQMTQTFGFRDSEITAPGCPWHGPEGKVPGAAPIRAPGPAGACRGAAWPHLPCARPHWGPARGLHLYHFGNPPPPARDMKILLIIAQLLRVGREGTRRAA